MSEIHSRRHKANLKVLKKINRTLKDVGESELRPGEKARALLIVRDVDADASSARVPILVSLSSALIAFLAIGFSSTANIPVFTYVLLGVLIGLVALNSLRDAFSGDSRAAGKAALEIVASRRSRRFVNLRSSATSNKPSTVNGQSRPRRLEEPRHARREVNSTGPLLPPAEERQ